ncbi:MAG TPA: hypothetical protein VG713_05865 [Pirellulales bacterium]|nr:hypothetical protein [Pirellulales bacterium]
MSNPSEPAKESVPAEAAEAPPSAEVLKAAFNAFKKRLKLTRLDQESRIGRNPMSAGGASSIVGITPPNQYPRAVWEELVRQGKLKRAGSGMYSMP